MKYMKKVKTFHRTALVSLSVAGFLSIAAVVACSGQNDGGNSQDEHTAAKTRVQTLELMPEDWVNKDPEKAQILIPIPWPKFDEARNIITSEVITGIEDSKQYTDYMRIYIYQKADPDADPPVEESLWLSPYIRRDGANLVNEGVFSHTEDVPFVSSKMANMVIDTGGKGFDILVLAGHFNPNHKKDFGGDPLLFAAGFLGGQTVRLNQENLYTVNLYTVRYALEVPEKVHVTSPDEQAANIIADPFSITATVTFTCMGMDSNTANYQPAYPNANYQSTSADFHFYPGENKMAILPTESVNLPYFPTLKVSGLTPSPHESLWKTWNVDDDTIVGSWRKIPAPIFNWNAPDLVYDVEVDDATGDEYRIVHGVFYHEKWGLDFFGINSDITKGMWSLAEYNDPLFQPAPSPYALPIDFTTGPIPEDPTTIGVIVDWGNQ